MTDRRVQRRRPRHGAPPRNLEDLSRRELLERAVREYGWGVHLTFAAMRAATESGFDAPVQLRAAGPIAEWLQLAASAKIVAGHRRLGPTPTLPESGPLREAVRSQGFHSIHGFEDVLRRIYYGDCIGRQELAAAYRIKAAIEELREAQEEARRILAMRVRPGNLVDVASAVLAVFTKHNRDLSPEQLEALVLLVGLDESRRPLGTPPADWQAGRSARWKKALQRAKPSTAVAHGREPPGAAIVRVHQDGVRWSCSDGVAERNEDQENLDSWAEHPDSSWVVTGLAGNPTFGTWVKVQRRRDR